MTDYGFGTIGAIGENGMNTVDWAAMNKGITPVFQIVPVQNEKESEAQGRAVYTDTEVVLLYIAGDQNSVHSQPVDNYIKRRFPEQYEHWKRTNEGRRITGTPLRMWPMATPAFIKEMEHINVFSVDDLANIADVHMSKMQDGRIWRDRAQAWLDNAKETSVSTRFAAENDRLKERLEALEARLRSETQKEFAEELEAPIPEKRAYHRKGPRPGNMKPEHREAARQRMKAMWAKRKAAEHGGGV